MPEVAVGCPSILRRGRLLPGVLVAPWVPSSACAGWEEVGGSQVLKDLLHQLFLAGRQLFQKGEGGAVHHLCGQLPAVLLGGVVDVQEDPGQLLGP